MKKRMATWGFVFAVFGWIIGRGKGFDADLDVMAIDALLFGALGLGIGFLLSKLPSNTVRRR